jgi:hypothetical protein
MNSPRALLVLVAPILLVTAAPASARSQAANASAGCTAFQSIGVDTTFAGYLYGAYLGSGLCQTFVAPETLISAVTVWRAPILHAMDVPLKLWILNVDSTGLPLADSVVLDGPIWEQTSPDSVNPTEVTYSFDPPVVLPSRGMYSIVIQDYQCVLYFDLLTTAQFDDRYPQGHMWYAPRSDFFGCILRPGMSSLSTLDLIFTIHFCDMAVPARKTSWGQLKMHYR